MEIILVRHGKPEALGRAVIAGHDIGQWARAYNAAGINRQVEPPERLRRLAASAGYVVASDLRRSRESAEWLASSQEIRIDPDLREAALPDSMGVSLRMPPGAWIVIARTVWYLGRGSSDEPIQAARRRAGRVAHRLSALAREYEVVLVVGHAVFNRMIAAHLQKSRWQGPKILLGTYWDAARFVRRRRPA